MGLFDFFKKKKVEVVEDPAEYTPPAIDESLITAVRYGTTASSVDCKIYEGPGEGFRVVGEAVNKREYSITETYEGFGKLVSGTGWIKM